MPLFHCTTTTASMSPQSAIQNGMFVILEGINWMAGEPWVDAALQTAGFEHAVIYWPGPVSPSVGIDFSDHSIAARAIVALDNTKCDGYTLKARWHEDTPPKYKQQLAKASASLPSHINSIRDRPGRTSLSSSTHTTLQTQMPAEPTNWPKDQRKCQRPTDIVNTNAPQKDTAKFFPFEVQNFYKQFGGEQWRPGFPIIEDKGWVPNADQAKACVSFYNQQGATEPRFLTNNVAAECDWIPTSRGFLVDHPRGPLNGLGWGDFDNFTEWQDQGRKVTLDMLEKKVWRTGCKELLIFVPAPGEPPREPFVVDVQFDHSDQTDPDAPGDPGKSLFELLENKKERNKTRDELYRRGRGGRGGRGGHGGRG